MIMTKDEEAGLKGREAVRRVLSSQAGQALSRLTLWPWPITGWLRAAPTRPIHPRLNIPQVEGDFQLTPEAVCEGRVHVQHLQQVCPLDLVQVTVGQARTSALDQVRPGMEANGLSKDVILSCQPEGRGNLPGLLYFLF